jgi:hypothetical protein
LRALFLSGGSVSAEVLFMCVAVQMGLYVVPFYLYLLFFSSLFPVSFVR